MPAHPTRSIAAWPLLALCLVGGCAPPGGSSAGDPATPAALDDALRGLRARDPATRARAAARLAAMGPAAAKAVPALSSALKDRDLSVKAAAAHALGEIGPDARPALPTLEALSRQETLRDVVTRARARIGREPGTP
jgi:HEAT repeat protein